MLYTLSYSPYLCDLFTLLRVINQKDCLLLLSDGVISGVSKSPAEDIFKILLLDVYALYDDVVARGLICSVSYNVNIKIINYVDFVRLTEKHKRYLSW